MISTTLKPTAKFIASAVARENDNDLPQKKKNKKIHKKRSPFFCYFLQYIANNFDTG